MFGDSIEAFVETDGPDVILSQASHAQQNGTDGIRRRNERPSARTPMLDDGNVAILGDSPHHPRVVRSHRRHVMEVPRTPTRSSNPLPC